MTNIVRSTLADPRFQAARADLQRGYDRFIDELITLTEIPAPPFKEERRAAAYMAMMRENGIPDAHLDDIGNVCGVLHGTGNAGHVVVCAHMDTVFPQGTDVAVRREGTRLHAPGIGDNTRGLATNLALLRALRAAGIRPEKNILFVGSIGEEGKGDLRGVRHLLEAGPYRDHVEAFIGIDGPETARIVTRAVGSRRYRVTFRGPGGHSFGAFGIVNPGYAMAAVLTGLSRLHLPTDPKTTATPARVGGGTAINAIPDQIWFELDLRSTAPEELTRIDNEFRALVDQAVTAENKRADTANGMIQAELTKIGDRPAGATDPDADIIAQSLAAIRSFDFEPRLAASSTDANFPISLGIPAVCIGTGSDINSGAHTPGENIDVEKSSMMRSQSALLATLLAVAGIGEDHPI